MVKYRSYDPDSKAEVYDAVRREIQAARIKVALDKELGRTTSPMVRKLAEMPVPDLPQASETSQEPEAPEPWPPTPPLASGDDAGTARGRRAASRRLGRRRFLGRRTQ